MIRSGIEGCSKLLLQRGHFDEERAGRLVDPRLDEDELLTESVSEDMEE